MVSAIQQMDLVLVMMDSLEKNVKKNANRANMEKTAESIAHAKIMQLVIICRVFVLVNMDGLEKHAILHKLTQMKSEKTTWKVAKI